MKMKTICDKFNELNTNERYRAIFNNQRCGVSYIVIGEGLWDCLEDIHIFIDDSKIENKLTISALKNVEAEDMYNILKLLDEITNEKLFVHIKDSCVLQSLQKGYLVYKDNEVYYSKSQPVLTRKTIIGGKYHDGEPNDGDWIPIKLSHVEDIFYGDEYNCDDTLVAQVVKIETLINNRVVYGDINE